MSQFACRVVRQLQEFKSAHASHLRQPHQLAYPRSLRNLLPWAHGLLRSTAFRGGAEVSPDERCAMMAFLMVRALVVYDDARVSSLCSMEQRECFCASCSSSSICPAPGCSRDPALSACWKGQMQHTRTDRPTSACFTLASVVLAAQVAPAELLCLVAYPAVFDLTAPGWGAEGQCPFPPTVPAGSAYLNPQATYLVDAGYISFLWVGSQAPHGLVKV